MNSPRTFAPLAASLREFVLSLGDAVLVLDAAGRIVVANAAAQEALGVRSLQLPASLEETLGHAGAQRVQALLSSASALAPPRRHEAGSPGDWLPVALAGGQAATVSLHRLDPSHCALTLRQPLPPRRERAGGQGGGSEELIAMFWDSPFPATLQGADHRLIAVNDAFVQFTGFEREQLIGIDPVALQPEEDRAAALEARMRVGEGEGEGAAPPGGQRLLFDRRLIDASGRERWFRRARQAITGDKGATLYLSILQDSSAEHLAREQADRSERDLDQWFTMSPLGMVLYDETGLLVRTNPAFEALAGPLPVTLAEAPASVQELLAWEAGGPGRELVPGMPPLAREAWAPRPEGGQRRLRALVRAYETPGGHRRYMAAVEDLSAEEERDLARMQIGALMDTAAIGVATLQGSTWVDVRGPQAPHAPSRDAGRVASGLQSIGRDVVLPESLADYERVQQALRTGQRAEARYAIRHPELGMRWLLTRVEPGQLASGKRTTSVVTLDITDQEQARSRNEQLLRELGTILESSPAGIVYVRGELLVRCNRRFERMVGLPPGTAAGRDLRTLFGGMPVAQRMVNEILRGIEPGTLFETEFQMPRPDGAVQWVSLSVHSSRSPLGVVDAVALLTDITRLKLQQAEFEALARDRMLMFSLSDVGIAFLMAGRIQRANEALERLTGYDAATLAGLDIGALFQDRAQFHQAWAVEDAALRQAGRWSGERQLRRADGSLLWVQVSKRLVVEGDPGGGIIASYVNVDDRRRAEASLAQQAATTRAVLDSVLVGIVTVGHEGIEWMNRSARRMFGGELADFVGRPIAIAATPEPDHPFRRTHYIDALAEGQAETFECRVKALDGREFWVAGNAVATGGGTRGRQLTYALLDIESRRNAELRTAHARASLQRIIDVAPMAITLRDARTLKVLQVNPAALAMIGRPRDEVIGRTLEQMYPGDIAARARAQIEAALAGADATPHEYTLELGGATRIWEARVLAIRAPGEPPSEVLTIATEVTEQRAAEQAKIDAAIAQRDMLVKEVHHRIKNNLQGVAGLMQQIAQRRPEMAPVIAEVVGQVQAIAQVYGLQVGSSEALRVRSVIEAIIGSVQRTFGREIAMSVEGPAAQRWREWVLPEAESIPIALTVNELLTNAIKHGTGAALRCVLTLEDERVRIAVCNPGSLPAGFDLARVPGGVSGLGLVRALLPRRHARLTLEEDAGTVVAAVVLVPPGVRVLASA